jgi:uncharacterized protein
MLKAPPVGERRATFAHVAPFVVFVAVMAVEHALSLPLQWAYPVRGILTLLVLLLFSRQWIALRPFYTRSSVLVGAAVFVIWIAPDLLFSYRHSWLFDNWITGSANTGFPADLRRNYAFLVFRTASAALLVPVVEELFWRSWLMRSLIRHDFLSVPLGTYSARAFWVTAVLFASEHGAYWEVGLAAGIIYNWWLIRTRSLADCILAHAVTNALLAAYVLAAGQWQYWL